MTNTNKWAEIIQKIAVVIPTYKARKHILGVINEIGPEVARIYVVDDWEPLKTAVFSPPLSQAA